MLILTSTSFAQKKTDFKHLQCQLDQPAKVLQDSSEIAHSTSPLKSLLKVNITIKKKMEMWLYWTHFYERKVQSFYTLMVFIPQKCKLNTFKTLSKLTWLNYKFGGKVQQNSNTSISK